MNHYETAPALGRCRRLGVFGLLALLWCVAPGRADRCVLVEDFCATWCGPCVYAGLALSQLQDQYPLSIAVLQEHVNDGTYTIPWGTDRFNSYPNHPSIPDVWFDGTLQKLGADSQIYGVYLDLLNQRLAVPTDVTVEIGGQQVSGSTFTFQVRVSLAAGSAPKPVRVYLIQALDYYPSGAHYRDCLMAATPTEDLTLVPGQSQIVERAFTFGSTSWSDQADIRMLAWAQLPADSGVREVYQAHLASWPFTPLPPQYDAGDLNCDGAIDFDDINPFVLYMSNQPAWQALYPDCPPTVGDINGDGTYGQGTLSDVNPFVALLTGGG